MRPPLAVPPGVPQDYAVTFPGIWALITLIPPPPSGSVPAEAIAVEAKKRDRSSRILQVAAGTCVRAQASATDLSFYFRVPRSGAWLLLDRVRVTGAGSSRGRWT